MSEEIVNNKIRFANRNISGSLIDPSSNKHIRSFFAAQSFSELAGKNQRSNSKGSIIFNDALSRRLSTNSDPKSS